jgi:predicted PurR-regulated permease PerM
MWIHKPFFKYITGLILVLLAIFLFGKIDYFVAPFQKFITVIFFPILVAGLFYYILRPVVRFLAKYMPKLLGIILVYLVFIGLGFMAVQFLGPSFASQFQKLSENFPENIEEVTSQSKETIRENSFGLVPPEDIEEKAYAFFQETTSRISGNMAEIFSAITSVATVLVLVPFLLFYFLKDDHLFRPYLVKRLPEEHVQEGNKILVDIDKTLFQYIIGQFFVAMAVGILMFIGYLIIGLDNALLLAVFAMLLTVVPLLGPVIGIIPAIFAALLQDPFMVVKVLIVFVVVQQLEGNLVEPQVFGKKLNLHPVTVILLLLVAGSLYGFIGILIAVPLYSVVKAVVKDFWRFYKLRKKEA